MKYYFSGSEIESWRNLLVQENIPTVALSYVGLKRRLKKSADNWTISENYPESQQVFLDSGAYTLNKKLSEYTEEQARELVDSYWEFALSNQNSLTLISEFDALILGKETIRQYRAIPAIGLPPEKFMPIWHAEDGKEELEKLCSEYNIVGVTSLEIHDTSMVTLFNQMIYRYGVKLHGVAITSKEMMRLVNWDSVSSMSWLSPIIYGDTIIWTGHELKRYPKAYKAKAREAHRNIFRDNGFDEDKIANDDSTELLRLSLWSWQQFVSSLNTRVTTMYQPTNSDFLESSDETVDTQGVEKENEKLLPVVPEKAKLQVIPITGIKFQEPEEEGSEESSYIKQLRSLRRYLIEMQLQRVLLLQESEISAAGYADPNLSKEIDRLSRLIKAAEDADKAEMTYTRTETLSVNRPGFFSETFGLNAANKIRQLESSPDNETLDAEIVDGK